MSVIEARREAQFLKMASRKETEKKNELRAYLERRDCAEYDALNGTVAQHSVHSMQTLLDRNYSENSKRDV
jgi:hypothetical protein